VDEAEWIEEMKEKICGWCCIYNPGRPPRVLGPSVTEFDSHGICQDCMEHFLAGEGARWQVWETRPGMGLPDVAALPTHFDRGYVISYRVRALTNGGSDKVIDSRVLGAHWQFTGRVLEEVEA
jgi:hypothetical protein